MMSKRKILSQYDLMPFDVARLEEAVSDDEFVETALTLLEERTNHLLRTQELLGAQIGKRLAIAQIGPQTKKQQNDEINSVLAAKFEKEYHGWMDDHGKKPREAKQLAWQSTHNLHERSTHARIKLKSLKKRLRDHIKQ